MNIYICIYILYYICLSIYIYIFIFYIALYTFNLENIIGHFPCDFAYFRWTLCTCHGPCLLCLWLSLMFCTFLLQKFDRCRLQVRCWSSREWRQVAKCRLWTRTNSKINMGKLWKLSARFFRTWEDLAAFLYRSEHCKDVLQGTEVLHIVVAHFVQFFLSHVCRCVDGGFPETREAQPCRFATKTTFLCNIP